MNGLLITVFALFTVSALASTFLWAIWIAPFVREHGRKNVFFLFNGAPLLDYRTAVRVSRETGLTPWFVKAYGMTFTATFVLFVLGLVLCVLS